MGEISFNISKALNMIGGEYVLQLLVVALIFLPLPKRSRSWLRCLACYAAILAFAALSANFFPIPVPWHYFVYFFVLTASNAVIYRCSAVRIIFISLCMYCLQHLASCLSYGIVFFAMYLARDWRLYDWYYLIMLCTFAVTLAAAYFLVVRRVAHKDFAFNNVYVVFVSCVFILLAALFTYSVRNDISWSLSGLAALMGIAVMYSLMTLMLVFANIKSVSLKQENIILTQLLNKDRQRYEQNKLSNEKIQIKYHDLKKLQREGMVNYPELAEVEADKEILFSTYFTGNNALDVVLSEQALMCERLGIRFICTADGSAVDFMKPHHIYSFMINALENCIESVKKRQDHREVHVFIFRRGDMCIIKTSNYTDAEKIPMSGGVPATTKANKEEHGFGVKSMQNVVRTYGGNLRFFIKDHNFTVVAAIPVPKNKTLQ